VTGPCAWLGLALGLLLTLTGCQCRPSFRPPSPSIRVAPSMTEGLSRQGMLDSSRGGAGVAQAPLTAFALSLFPPYLGLVCTETL
jgi:hypothetical protein